jgi:hypothetical protein
MINKFDSGQDLLVIVIVEVHMPMELGKVTVRPIQLIQRVEDFVLCKLTQTETRF